MAGGKGGSGTSIADQYFMSIHMGVCSGPVDAILGISVGEKVAWTGNVTSVGVIPIDQPNLFGGLKEQGGVGGDAVFLPGNSTQVLYEGLAERLGLTDTTCPAFRGITSVFFVHELGAGKGFYWTANSPFLQDVWFRVVRQPVGLDPANNQAPASDGSSEANPASIIYECLTNTDWGMGAPTTSIDTATFNAAAATLFTENLFISMMWARSDTIENFVSEVLGHINGMLFTHPLTGLLTLKLLRDDYDHGDMPVISPDNATISNYKRKLYGETTNEIVVTYTDPKNEQAATVTVQDLANIQIQNGEIISDSRNYYGVRTPTLAAVLGQRDLRIVSLPLIGCVAQVDRTLWSVFAGDVVMLTWPEYGVDSVIMRVMQVDYGKKTDPKIKLTLAQDVFGLSTADFSNDSTGDTLWVDPSEAPRTIDYAQVITVPAFFLSQEFGDQDPGALSVSEVFAGVLAAQNSHDTWRYDLYATKISPIGISDWADYGRKDLLWSGTLPSDVAQEASTVLASITAPIGQIPQVGDFVFFGTGTDDECEITAITAIDAGTGAFSFDRGLLDTTPQAWPTGTRVWGLTPGIRFMDHTIRAVGEAVSYKVLTQTSLDLLDVTAAAVLNGTLIDRPHMPLRPANVTVNSLAFGTLNATGLSSVTISWANRNRLTETAQILQWTDATVTPESGQTTTVRILDSTGAFIEDIDGITGTSYVLDLDVFGSGTSGYVQMLSKCAGLVSLQGHKIKITTIDASDYGSGYGLNYGG